MREDYMTSLPEKEPRIPMVPEEMESFSDDELIQELRDDDRGTRMEE